MTGAGWRGRHVRGRVVGALPAVAGLLGGPACAEEPKVDLKLSHWLPPAHPLQQAIADWADFEAAGRAKVAAEPGQEIIPLAPAQRAAWRAAAAPLQQSWAETVRRPGFLPTAPRTSWAERGLAISSP